MNMLKNVNNIPYHLFLIDYDIIFLDNLSVYKCCVCKMRLNQFLIIISEIYKISFKGEAATKYTLTINMRKSYDNN